mgnify:CR=1 FL=1
MKKVGLYFGTFNPIHIGHLVIANHMAEYSDLDEIWFVVTPVSPFKKKKNLLANNHRYEMVYLATKDYPKLQPSKIEFDLEMFNKITKGGLSRKSLNIVLAGTGVGKSLFMCHCAAANLSAGKNVLYITLEMAEENYAGQLGCQLISMVTFT